MFYQIEARLAWQIVDGHAIVLDAQSGAALCLNRVGTLIWSLLGAHSADAIAEAVAGEFDVEASQAKADVIDFLKDLRERGLVTERV